MSEPFCFALPRRRFLQATGLAAAGSLFPSLCRAGQEQRPNILWITTEDMSPDMGCYGDAYAVTPNLDRLAGQGVRFTNAFAVAGVCAPSRSGIITGMYPCSIGTHHMRCQGVPPAYVKCFPEYLRAAGYYCTNNVKTDYNFDAPVTAWDESSAKAHWRNRAPGQPFFAVFNNTVTHESQIRLSPEEFEERTRALAPEERHDPAEAVLPPYYPDTPATRLDWARYHDLITVMDKQSAALLRQLEEDGLADDTIVFFYGDHGRGLPRAKRWLYDSGLRAPLIIRWPGRLPAGTVSDELVSFVDLAPTLLSLAGVEVPSYMQGRPFLGQQAAPPRTYVYGTRDRMDEAYDIIRAVRDKRFKYLRNFQPDKPYVQYIDYMEKMPTMQELRRLNKLGQLMGPEKLFFRPEKPVEELYDTEADPHEINNLAEDPRYRETLEQMRAALKEWMDSVHDLALVPEEELKERVRPGGKWSVTAEPSIEPAEGRYTGPVDVRIACETEGASIAYTTETGPKPHWLLYSSPLTLDRSAVLRVKACRLGYKDSPEVVRNYEVGE